MPNPYCAACVAEAKGPSDIVQTGDRRPDQVVHTPPQESTTVYVFWHKRPADVRAWAVCYESKELAESCKFRVGPVIPVVLPGTPRTVS